MISNHRLHLLPPPVLIYINFILPEVKILKLFPSPGQLSLADTSVEVAVENA